MTTNPVLSPAAVQAMLNGLTTLFNGGAIKIFTGSQPAACGTGDSGTALAHSIGINATSFAAAASNASSDGKQKMVANAISSDTNAANTGTAGYFRAYSSGGTCHAQGTVGTSSADLILNTTSISSGDTVSITGWTIFMLDGSGTD